jgi:GTP-binding protein
MAQMKFIKSAVHPPDFPPEDRWEVAISGRSNSGKSTFINALAGQKIAKVSQVAGKTRLLNFFDVGEFYRLVDMPGYGYASRSGSEISDWGKMIEIYLSDRPNLAGALLIMDIRRDWTPEEQSFLNFFSALQKPVLVMLNKIDQLKKSDIPKRHKILTSQSGQQCFVISAERKIGVKEVEDFFFHHWIKPLESAHQADKIKLSDSNS